MNCSTYSVRPFSGQRFSENADKAYSAGLTPCAICGVAVKDLAKAAQAVVIDGGSEWGDEQSPQDAGYMGCWPVGPDCHRRFVVKPPLPLGLSQEVIAAALAALKRELEDPRMVAAITGPLPPGVKRSRTKRIQPNHAGLRYWARARSTGTHVGIYDGIAAGMDTDAGRWQTVCHEHGWIISHETLALARRHAPCPEEWCEVCSGEEPAKETGGA